MAGASTGRLAAALLLATAAPAQAPSREALVGGERVRWLAAGPAAGPAVLLLHGARFRATTWQELGTIGLLAENGYRVLALDLPGYGDSPESRLPRDAFLAAFMEAAGLDLAVVVSPSMSGAFSLPLLAEHPERVAGFVAVAPAAVDEYADRLPAGSFPSLLVWGANDRIVPLAVAERLAERLETAQTLVLEDAGHACYLDQPERFHDALLAFLTRAGRR